MDKEQIRQFGLELGADVLGFATLKDPRLLHIYQAQCIGFQYFCNKCLAVCPACIEI